MILVADTGPLIALAKIDKLDLLKTLIWQTVYVPGMVQKELWGKIGSESERIETALDEYIHVMRLPSTNLVTDFVTTGLGDGEKQVILLAMSMREGTTLLLDDQAGRKAARQLGLSVIGTAGILIMAKEQGLIPHVIPYIVELRKQNYWFSDEFVAYLQRLTGEKM